MPTVTVHVPAPLRDLIGGRPHLEVEARTLDQAMQRLAEAEPLLGARIFGDDGRVRGHVNLFLDGRDVRDLAEEERRITGPAEVTIVPSIAGGSPREAGGEDFTPEEAIRYDRQLILPGMGIEGQRRLREASVLVVGAGGLGSPAALYLAAAGVGRIGVLDSDRVELSNLHRQILHDTPSVGRTKVDSAGRRLRGLNPDIEVVPIEARLTAENALELMAGWDLVVDGSDNFPTRYLVNDACTLLGIPCVFGAVFRFEGQVSVFAHPDGPCYRCIFRDPPPSELVPSCAEAGVLGVLPGLLGTIQAAEAVKLLIGLGTTLVGRLLLVDAGRMEFREVRVRRDPACMACGDSKTLSGLMDYDEFCGIASGTAVGPTTTATAPEIDVRELETWLREGRPLQLVDVREEHEWTICNLGSAGAKLIPLGQLFAHLDDLDRETDVVVYCRSGHRSAVAVQMLRAAGIGGAVNLGGGINAWAMEIDPSMPTY